MSWTPASWRSRPARQLPSYPDPVALKKVEERLRGYPALVFEGEVDRLRRELAQVARGEAFLLQGGDCAESFRDFGQDSLRDTFRILLQMAVVLTFGARKPVVKVGRLAGQFAKPRSDDFETQGDRKLPSYRGDIINDAAFDEGARRPDPTRMERAYFQSAATLNLLRAFASGGLASLGEAASWNLDFARKSRSGALYSDLADRIADSLTFLGAVGMGDASSLRETEFYTSHEALLLPYEEALVREEGGRPYSGSAHMLWIGDRTRDPDGAHAEFARGLRNPLGLKCGPSLKEDDLLRLLDLLDPEREPGRITLISRFGAADVGRRLPSLVRRVKAEGRPVIWCCDPMHGNTHRATNGIKTRSFERILEETRGFFEVHQAEGTVAGGVHFELTGRDVVECVGGGQGIEENDLASDRYETLCDPRLNATQALEMAFEICRRLR